VKQIVLAVPDLVSNSYFPAIAAVELGFFADEGLAARTELIFPNYRAFEALCDGKIDLAAGPAHAALPACPQWQGLKLLGALAQGTFWLLVMRADIAATPGDVGVVRGRTIGAAPLVDLSFKRLLADAGIDLARDRVNIIGVPGTMEPGVSFGIAAARALEAGVIDGFWANAMGADNAVRSGVGKIVLDVRRGLGPASAFHYTFSALMTSDRALARDPDMIAAALRAVVRTQHALAADPALAGKVGEKLFPAREAATIADIIARDAAFYDARISREAVTGLNAFAQNAGLLKEAVAYDDLVATQFEKLWTEGSSAS
jgi:ABC-type nitrate/sulfonate/bicarbonate transport system substrate-binding protein